MNNKKKNIIKVAIVVAVLIVATIIYNVAGCTRRDIKTLTEVETKSNLQIMNFDGNILLLGYDGAKLLADNGQPTGEIDYPMQSPHADIRGDYMVLYDKGGKNVALYNGTHRCFTYESEQAIKKAKVNKDGDVLLLTDEVGYNFGISVLSPKGIVEYIWKIGDVYIIDADISPDGKKIGAAAISTETGVIQETIIFADIVKEEETARVVTGNSVPVAIKFADSGSAIVVSDNKAGGYLTNGVVKWSMGYGNRLLDAFEIDNSGNTVLAFRGIQNNTGIEMYTKNGSITGDYYSESEVKALSVNGRHIALYEEGKVSLINYSGKETASVETKKEYADILITDSKDIVLIGESSIDLLPM